MLVNLIDYVNVISGGTPKTQIKEYWNGNIPWLTIDDFRDVNKYIYRSFKAITNKGLQNSATNILHPNDIIISARGTVGKIALIYQDMTFNQSCFGLRVKDTNVLNPEYLFYYLKCNLPYILKKSKGAVFDTITINSFKQIKINLPSINEQLYYARIISNIDEQIERNNNVVKRLQVLAQTIFNKFYQNKMLNFNGTLNNLCSLPSGYNFKPDSYISNGKYNLITIKNVNGIFVDYHKTNKINELPDNLKSYCKLNIGDILISLTGNVGRISINSDSNGLLNQRVSIILCKNNDYKLYIYLLLNNPYYQLKITQMANGTSQKNLSPLDIEKFKIYIPYNIKEFNNVTKGLLDQMCKIHLQTSKLIAIKNKILPFLINGQLK